MSIDTLLITGFILAALVGAVIGSILLFRNPGNWIGFVGFAFEKLKPILVTYMLKRMTPEEERLYHDAIRRGQEWDPFRKRPRDK